MESANTQFEIEPRRVIEANTHLAFYKPSYILTINGQDGPLARIEANGDMTVLKEDVNAAAKMFWQAIYHHRPRCSNCNGDMQLV